MALALQRLRTLERSHHILGLQCNHRRRNLRSTGQCLPDVHHIRTVQMEPQNPERLPAVHPACNDVDCMGKYYLTSAQISWPWLVLGNAFARTLSMAQWYEFLGTLGGSLWIWACNLGLFGIMVSLSDGSWSMFNAKAKTAAAGGYLLLLAAPIALSMHIYNSYDEVADKTIDVVVLQPNIDPYQKFQALSQDQQDAILAGQLTEALTKQIPAGWCWR